MLYWYISKRYPVNADLLTVTLLLSRLLRGDLALAGVTPGPYCQLSLARFVGLGGICENLIG